MKRNTRFIQHESQRPLSVSAVCCCCCHLQCQNYSDFFFFHHQKLKKNETKATLTKKHKEMCSLKSENHLMNKQLFAFGSHFHPFIHFPLSLSLCFSNFSLFISDETILHLAFCFHRNAMASLCVRLVSMGKSKDATKSVMEIYSKRKSK